MKGDHLPPNIIFGLLWYGCVDTQVVCILTICGTLRLSVGNSY
jgi:hypothetical protein